MLRYCFSPLILIAFVTWTGCATQSGGENVPCDLAAPECPQGFECSAILDSESLCLPPLIIRGTVLDATDDQPIAGALILAVDVNGAPVGTSGETDNGGVYTLTVPALRDADGMPIEGSFSLRAQAAAYQSFPSPIRPALPLDASTAVLESGTWVIDETLTIVKLLPLQGDTTNLGSISGTVTAASKAGILIIADGAAGAFTGFTNADGTYTIFNLPAGDYSIRGFAAGVQLTPTTATIVATEQTIDVNLDESTAPLSIVTGSVQIVNAPGGAITSVVLAVASTFVADAARGEVPPGLRVGDVTSDFTITGVPDGEYVVLAAFENDGLVRDPDQTIGGTQIVQIVVPDPANGNVVNLSESFKVTGALSVVSPGADGLEQVSTPTPVLEWEDDSSEDGYEIRVFDAFGNEIWNAEIGSVSGSVTVSHTYAGPALVSGMVYQFRASSFREKNGVRTAISTTEDLKGVFQYIEAP